ncbi:MAG: hypothetical protein M1823_001727 [Watsoniomyces obsoletus]|nr:MAG: hypothetical protein M1823_001727 [Watsoniomyces obsoletus]
MRPYTAPIFDRVQSGDVQGMLDLIRSRQASPFDVDPYGLGLLLYGADYCWRRCGGRLPCEALLENYLMSGGDGVDIVEVATIFGWAAMELLRMYTFVRKFSPLHQVILGLHPSQPSLEAFLSTPSGHQKLRDLVCEVDSTGRTALAYAVEYGRRDVVTALLDLGADPCQNVPSGTGHLPLLHVALAGPPDDRFRDIMRMLVQAGADVNATDHQGWTALHIAASWGALDIVDELVDCGADVQCLTTAGESVQDLLPEPIIRPYVPKPAN